MFVISSLRRTVEKKKAVLIAILLLASLLRVGFITHVPPSASLDEASITYNAYSVLKTGVDEFGEFPLVSQRGYDDWRRSTYLLLVIPFVALFDLSVVAARLPAVILSVLTVWATYEIIRHLFDNKSKDAVLYALVGALILAISPWHIYISRIGHESNACLSFLVFGMTFFLKGLHQKKYLFFSALFLTLSMVSYYSGQIFIPLMVLGIFALYGKNIVPQLLQGKKSIAVSVVSLALIAFATWAVFSPDALIRYRGTSTLSPEAHQELFDMRVRLRNMAVENNDIIGTIIYNRHLFLVQVLFEGYISHFGPEWLFTNSSSGSFKAPFVVLLNAWELPFILLGIVAFMLKSGIDRRVKILIFIWFLLGPLPASIATQAPHAMRSYNILPTWQIFTAFGCLFLYQKFLKIKIFTLGLLFFLMVSGLVYFIQNYFYNFPHLQSRSFQYALAESIPVVLENQNKYKKIVFSNEDNLYQSYMLFLYHSKYDPKLYQRHGGTISGGYKETHAFGKYEFRPISWDKEKKTGVLFVGNPADFPKQIRSVYDAKYKDGSVGVKIVSQ